MLSKIEVINRKGASLMMPFEDFENGFGVTEIEGLDPVKATLVSSGFAGRDGALYHSSKRESRNLVLHIDLIPDFDETTAKSLRNQLYAFLMPKSEVTLRFHEALGSYTEIKGRVESFESPLFTPEPQVTISLLCFDPDFIDPNPFTKSGVTVASTDLTKTALTYLGSVEAGFVFTLNLDRSSNGFSIMQETPSGDTYALDFAASLLAGDKLVISTISGSRGASLTRGGNLTSILWGVSPQAKWLELEGPGDNLLRVSAAAAGIPWTIQYVNRYGGL